MAEGELDESIEQEKTSKLLYYMRREAFAGVKRQPPARPTAFVSWAGYGQHTTAKVHRHRD